MKKLLLILIVILSLKPGAHAQSGSALNTNILIVTGSGNSNDNTWFFYSTNLWYANGASGYTNSASDQLYLDTNGTPAWVIVTNGGSVSFQDYFTLAASPQSAWSDGFAPAPAPSVVFWSAITLTNWISATSNYWQYPGDTVSFNAGGRNMSSGSKSNAIVVQVDGNSVFTGPWSAAGGFPWYLSGTVQWDGTNFISTGHFVSGDSNNPTGDDYEVFTNVMVGTNRWSFAVYGDTNGLKFDAAAISAGRAPTNDSEQHVLGGTPLPPGLVTNGSSATAIVTNGPNSSSIGTNAVTINGGSLFLKSTNGSTYFGGGQYYHQLFTTNEDMYILPQGNNAGRLYFGNPSTPQMFYSLNFAGVTIFESLPPLIGPSLADNSCGLYNLNTGTPNLTAYYSVIIAGGFFANPPALNYASTASLIVTNPTATEVVEQIIGNNIQTGDLLDFWVNGAKEANVSSNGQFTAPTIVVTNLTLTTTSAAPGSTTPVVWFAFTNAGKLYKVGGCQ